MLLFCKSIFLTDEFKKLCDSTKQPGMKLRFALFKRF